MLIDCPHCNELIWIDQLNCRIFRHGTFKHNYEQIPPHSSKQDCDLWKEQDRIYGCGKPFKINEDGTIVICNYI
jgi:hypothetical protein